MYRSSFFHLLLLLLVLLQHRHFSVPRTQQSQRLSLLPCLLPSMQPVQCTIQYAPSSLEHSTLKTQHSKLNTHISQITAHSSGPEWDVKREEWDSPSSPSNTALRGKRGESENAKSTTSMAVSSFYPHLLFLQSNGPLKGVTRLPPKFTPCNHKMPQPTKGGEWS